MTEMLDVVNAFSLPLQAAWVVWLTWAGCELAWSRLSPRRVITALPTARPRRSPGRSVRNARPV